MIVEHLVFSGGGARGLAYAAAYSELCASCTVRLRSLVGTSIGALVCALLSVGYTGKELEAMVTDLNLSDLTNISLMSVFSAWGLDDGSRLEKFVDDRLCEKTGDRAMTMKDLPVRATFVATNLNAAEAVYFSPDSHPDVRVSFAVRASMALPPLFAPVRYNNVALLVDGGLCDNFPIEQAPDPTTTVGFQLHWNNAFELSSIDTFFSRVVYVGLYRLSQAKTNRTAARVVSIDGGNVATLNMRVPDAVKQSLFASARSAVRGAVKAWEEKQ